MSDKNTLPDTVSTASVSGIILLHGAGLGAWIWDDVLPHLSLPTLAINFPNRDKKISNEGLSLNDYADFVAGKIAHAPFDSYILVCHSISGVVGRQLVKKLGDKLRGFVAVTAVIPHENGTFERAMPPLLRIISRVMFFLYGSLPPKAVLRLTLCNDVQGELCERVVDNFVPESILLFRQEVDGGYNECPSLYIETTLDMTLPQSVQRMMEKNLNACEIASVATGHLPMLSKPKELAGIINDFALRFDGSHSTEETLH